MDRLKTSALRQNVTFWSTSFRRDMKANTNPRAIRGLFFFSRRIPFEVGFNLFSFSLCQTFSDASNSFLLCKTIFKLFIMFSASRSGRMAKHVANFFFPIMSHTARLHFHIFFTSLRFICWWCKKAILHSDYRPQKLSQKADCWILMLSSIFLLCCGLCNRIWTRCTITWGRSIPVSPARRNHICTR